MKQLKSLKKPFIEALDVNIAMYKIIGMSTDESPMWMQLGIVSIQEKGLTFINSQKQGIRFTIDCPDDMKLYMIGNIDKAYDYFKYLKYSHIQENHPTVWNEMNLARLNAINSFVSEYKVVNPQMTDLQQLITDGVISHEEILEYAQQYMDAVDRQDDERIDNYYQNEYDDSLYPYDEMTEEDMEIERMRMLDEMYGEPDYSQEPERVRVDHPEYIVASTSFRMEETYIFACDAIGVISDWGEYGGLAKRWGCDNWEDHHEAVLSAMGDTPYRFERMLETGTGGVYHYLYSKINPADSWNESNESL